MIMYLFPFVLFLNFLCFVVDVVHVLACLVFDCIVLLCISSILYIVVFQ